MWRMATRLDNAALVHLGLDIVSTDTETPVYIMIDFK